MIELTDEVDLSDLPSGTRLIIRREPLHPGAQQTLFRALDFRYWGFYTDCDGDPVELDAQMRAHAHVEDHILRLKESGLLRFPFASLRANRVWLFVVALAADLVRWFQLLCLDGDLAKANRRPCGGRSSTLPVASSDVAVASSSVSSITGPPPRTSFTPTGASPPSPEHGRRQHTTQRQSVDPSRPHGCPWFEASTK